jgi:membrane protein YdbS with pleckstrin-like domain
MKLDFNIYGFWAIGSICLLLGSMIAGNLAWIEGTTTSSYILSLVISLILLLTAGLFWISAAVNAKEQLC